MKVFSLLWLLVTGLAISMAQDQCQNMWEVTDFLDPNLKICDGIFLKFFTTFILSLPALIYLNFKKFSFH
jgi:hypothetical protein